MTHRFTLAGRALLVAATTAGILSLGTVAATSALSAQQTRAAVRADQSHFLNKRISWKTPVPRGSLPSWRLVYSDTFTERRLNIATAWSAYNASAPGSNPVTGWWMASHAVVANGALTLKGAVDRRANRRGDVVTAGVGLWKLRPQTYGKWEVLVRMDRCTDVKYAWLLWPYSGRWPGDGEIDFAEDEGGNRAITTASLIYGNRAGQEGVLAKDRLAPKGGLSSWHVLGVEWTPKAVRYTIDGHYWGAAKTTHIPRRPMTLVLQTEGKVRPAQVNLGSRSCNAQVGWVTQYALR